MEGKQITVGQVTLCAGTILKQSKRLGIQVHIHNVLYILRDIFCLVFNKIRTCRFNVTQSEFCFSSSPGSCYRFNIKYAPSDWYISFFTREPFTNPITGVNSIVELLKLCHCVFSTFYVVLLILIKTISVVSNHQFRYDKLNLKCSFFVSVFLKLVGFFGSRVLYVSVDNSQRHVSDQYGSSNSLSDQCGSTNSLSDQCESSNSLGDRCGSSNSLSDRCGSSNSLSDQCGWSNSLSDQCGSCNSLGVCLSLYLGFSVSFSQGGQTHNSITTEQEKKQ